MRYQWLYSPIGLEGFRAIENGVSQAQFDADLGEGFILDSRREGCLSSRFILKQEKDEVVSNPFGNNSIIHRIWYETTSFNLYAREDFIELKSPPRALKRFAVLIAGMLNFKLALSAVNVDVLSWISEIEKVLGGHCTIRSLKSSGIPLGVDIVGAVHLKGGRDVREFSKCMRVCQGTVDVVSGNFRGESGSWEFSFGRRSAAIIKNVDGVDPITGIRHALSSAVRKTDQRDADHL